ncbi:flavin reductase family protein [Flavobacteriaceae bacterium]|jgi:flavin reductase (DIM6/NTAB) family NADH-FMN oxidoreductase RutF|nr:flavin reductase family protein [Flavobacteriaceae bacterium]
MLHLDPNELQTPELHGYLLGAIGPRPICFASTVDEEGKVNLAPYSFFNVFSARPPILIFSPARRVRGNTVKHTLENVQAVPEVVINVVNYAMVQQMSLASTEYPKGVNEFVKAGFTMEASEIVRPPRVKEAPVQLECKVVNVVPLGTEGGAGNLVMAQVERLHISQDILNSQGQIDPEKIDLVSRMGGNWYSRAKSGLFEVAKPNSDLGIGIDALPRAIRQSDILSGNDLAQLANVSALPEGAQEHSGQDINSQKKAKQLIEQGAIEQAWQVLIQE